MKLMFDAAACTWRSVQIAATAYASISYGWDGSAAVMHHHRHFGYVQIEEASEMRA